MNRLGILLTLAALFALAGCQEYEDAAQTAKRIQALEQQIALETATPIVEETPVLPTDEFGVELPDPDQGSLRETSGPLAAAANVLAGQEPDLPKDIHGIELPDPDQGSLDK